MMNPFYYYPKIQKRFKFQTTFESTILVLGGILLSVFELISITVIFPLMMMVLDPVNAVNGRIIGTLYKWSHLPSVQLFAVLLSSLVITTFAVKVGFHLLLWRYEFKLLSKWRIKISSIIFNTLMNCQFQQIQKDSSSKLVNVITSIVPYVVSNYLYQCINLLQTIFLFLLIFTYMGFINLYLLSFSMLFGAVTIISFIMLQKNKIKTLGGQSQLLSRELLATLQQSIAGYKETKIHQKEAYFSSQFEKVSKKIAHVDFSLLFTQNLPNILVEFISIAVIFSAFAFLVFTIDNLQASAIQIGMVVILGLRIVPLINRSIVSLSLIRSSLEPILQLFTVYQQLKPSAQATFAPQLHSEPVAFEHALRFENISFQYSPNSPFVLKDIHLEIKKGEHIGIVGPSGSGKTTLINIILGFLTEFQGQYQIDESSISTHNISHVRKLLSYVDQQPFLLDDNFIRNIAYGVEPNQIDIDKIIAVLNKVDLWEHVQSLEKGLYTSIGENGKYLSGGQRQRLTIARALYKDSQILVLDEASSSLDMDSEAKFIDFLASLKNEITIISIAHRLSTLKKCNRIIFIENGKIISQGSFIDLYSSVAIFKRYIDHSFIEVNPQ